MSNALAINLNQLHSNESASENAVSRTIDFLRAETASFMQRWAQTIGDFEIDFSRAQRIYTERWAEAAQNSPAVAGNIGKTINRSALSVGTFLKGLFLNK